MPHAQRNSHGRRDADGRRASNHHGTNGVGDLMVIGTGDVDFLARKAGLIDHDDAGVGPLYGFDHGNIGFATETRRIA